MNTIRIAFRNMARQRKRSILLGAAIAFGVLIVTLVNGFTAGLLGNVKENLSHLIGGHVFVLGSEVTDSGRLVSVIRDEGALSQAVAEAGIEPASLARRSNAFATLLFGPNDTMQRIEGVNWAEEPDTFESLGADIDFEEWISAEDAIVLPTTTAKELDVRTGDMVLAKMTTVTGQQNVGEFRVAAIVQGDSLFGFSSAFAHMSYLNSLLGISDGQYQIFSMYLTDMEDMDRVGDALHGSLSTLADVEARISRSTSSPMGMMRSAASGEGTESEDNAAMSMGPAGAMGMGNFTDERWEGTRYGLYTLNDVMEPLSQLVGILNTVSLAVFIILLLITMVGILNTFRMIMIERTREIGTMRSVGMQRGGVRNIFLLEALFVALAGTLAGLALAGIISAVFSLVRFSDAGLLAMFLRDSRMSIVLQAPQVIGSTLIIAALSLAAAFLPARKASRMDPAVALRTHY